jgi:hypothetical protein
VQVSYAQNVGMTTTYTNTRDICTNVVQDWYHMTTF